MKKVVGLGACVLDTLINCDRFPIEDTKQKAQGIFLSGGGPVGNALVVMSKLGIETEVLNINCNLSVRHGGVLLKVLLELFQKLVGAAAIGGRPPQRAKLPYPSKAPQKGECRASARQRGYLCPWQRRGALRHRRS